jgi:hypothetical protein
VKGRGNLEPFEREIQVLIRKAPSCQNERWGKARILLEKYSKQNWRTLNLEAGF